MYDVVALGELLIDFTPYGISEQGNNLFERNSGGAPANVLATLSKLGKKTAFLGKIGNDPFGFFLAEVLKTNGIDSQGLVFSDKVNTTLAFVHLQENGDRSFSFYRKPGADLTYEEQEVDYSLIKKGKIFRFGSVSMTDEPSRTATLSAVKYAKEHKRLITFDPNLRESLWESLSEAKIAMEEGMVYADIVKVSEEELHFLSGSKDLREGSKLLMRKFDIPLLFVTLGEKGCFYRYLDATGTVPSYEVKSIDATGAGDIFFGAILYKILENPGGFSQLTIDDIKEYVRFANAAGALATIKRGAIHAAPDLMSIEALLRMRKKS
jgi:sugar/nucleoside kinase (ribokinase family)